MKLTDDQIRSIMEKEIKCKTLLTDLDKVDSIVEEHSKDGWELINKTEINGRAKLTFRK